MANATNPRVTLASNKIRSESSEAGFLSGILKALSNNGKKTEANRFDIKGTIAIGPTNGTSRHIQSIAPHSNTSKRQGAISFSSDKAFFLTFTDASGAPKVTHAQYARCVTNPPHYASGETWNHGGGCQYLGDYLVLGVESDKGSGYVEIWQATPGTKPVFKRAVTGLSGAGTKASACCVTNYKGADGLQYVIIGSYDYNKNMSFVRISNESSSWLSAAEECLTKNTDEALNAEGTDGDTDTFQNFGLVTETVNGVDTVYLLGFREDEQLLLFKVNTDDSEGDDFGKVTFVRAYDNFDGSDWRYGMGLQSVSATDLRLFGTVCVPSGIPTNSSTAFGADNSSKINYTIEIDVYTQS